jgi:branched-chain amino acid transport system ATP-binding protein
MSTLAVSELTVKYGDVHAIESISLKVESGSVFSILGPNGAGKTTLLRTLAGVLSPTNGRIHLDGTDITNLSVTDRVRKGIIYQPETRELFPGLSVRKNIEFALKFGAKGRQSMSFEEVMELFPELKEKLERRPNSMSGGEQQMVALARSLISSPKILLLDEPSLGLSPKLVSRLFEVIGEFHRRFSTTIILAEQNANMALKISDFCLFLRTGTISLEGNAKELGRQDLSRYYLGIE